jgi:hypothetical protein
MNDDDARYATLILCSAKFKLGRMGLFEKS